MAEPMGFGRAAQGTLTTSTKLAADNYAELQDGAYLWCDGELAACDGSSGGAMGAAAVFRDSDASAEWVTRTLQSGRAVVLVQGRARSLLAGRQQC
eukprot:3569214-Rhodomonas_salina.1